MECSFSVEFAKPTGAASAPSPAAISGQPPLTFHELLSSLNPLQYVPVVGNIYRALTGDCPPEGVRVTGSFILSALTGGPLGMAINVAVTAAQKVTGIDLDQVAHAVMASVGLAAEAAPAPDLPAWTEAQRMAYGLGVAVPSIVPETTAIETSQVQSRTASAAYARAQQIDQQNVGHA